MNGRGMAAGCIVGAAAVLPPAVGVGQAASSSPAFEVSVPGASDSIPVRESAEAGSKRHALIPLPVLFYTPETRWGVGAAALHSFRSHPESRPTVSGANVVYTQNRQVTAEVQTTAYLQSDLYVVSADAGHTEFPDVFFGIGNATRAEDEEAFTSRVSRAALDVRRRVAPGVYVGAFYQARSAVMVERAEDGLLAAGGVEGSEGGLVSGVGAVAMWDTRDNILFPTTGSFHTASVFRSGGLLGSDFRMTRYSVDLRRYQSLRDGHVLGFHGFLRSVAGDVPFDMLPQLGGASIMRGTFQGRYRDRLLVAAQTEYRAHIWRRLGLAAFAGAGQVTPDMEAISLADLHYSLGFGFRFMIDPRERMNVRIDFGRGRHGATGVYITVGESF